MDLTVGAVLDGKVTGIMKFGAFVSLPGGKSGLVHISEIAYTYVNQVSDYLQVGQEVKVKVIGIDDAGRINLSIKKATDPPAVRRSAPPPAAPRPAARNSAPPSFEDKLKQFMQDSDSRMSGVRQYSEKKNSRRGRKADFDDDYD
jgi:S1 RNA binding domain protein